MKGDRYMLRLVWLAVLLLAKFCFAAPALIISDIHFNPYANCGKLPLLCKSLNQLVKLPVESWQFNQTKSSDYLQDTNDYLLTSALNSFKAQVSPNFTGNIFVTGDLLAHNFTSKFSYYKPFASKTLTTKFAANTILYVILQIHNSFPQSKIYLTLGNNDSDRGDYQTPSPKFLTIVANGIANYVPQALRSNFIRQFTINGYYSLPLDNHLQLIAFNSNLLSNKAVKSESAAKSELDWLSDELNQLKLQGKPAIILQHIPFGIDSYSTIKNNTPVEFLVPQLQQQYISLINQYQNANQNSVVANIYAGHSHSEYLQLAGNVPVVGTLALNRLFGNNAGLKLINYDQQSGQLNQFSTYTLSYTDTKLNTAKWTLLYSFPTSFKSSKSLKDFIHNFPADVNSLSARLYQTNYDGNSLYHPQPIHQDRNWSKYYCFINNLTIANYNQCIIAYQ